MKVNDALERCRMMEVNVRELRKLSKGFQNNVSSERRENFSEAIDMVRPIAELL